ncbi:DNA polymerase IV [Nakamurella endophytica]|uniref:DNA polymerase IV n=1 Tax=Nakamurella endophytica TaxID=1748367 RepID=A0A917T6F6_9ACTN|nr:DNA polymerase IV [Nakamurella endophytica]GGM11447.1 DNA polymerase IV [Nakamurella endophytica]
MGQTPGPRRHVTADPDAVDDTACTVLHVDMDAFFASVELRRQPELRGRPMMVAGPSQRGVVLSATYEARRYGIRSAMPTSRARLLCPDVVVVAPDHDAYRAASRDVMRLFHDVTPVVEPVSIDEAFLDVTGARRLAGRPGAIARDLRRRIADELGLTATVGASATKFVAKLASGLAKPDGLLVVPPADVRALLGPLPVRALWGVGPKSAAVLESLGIRTVGEVADTDPALLARALGPAAGAKAHELARGIDPRAVEPDVAEGSIGAESTFETDIASRTRMSRELLALAERTGRRARQAGVSGRVVVLKVRYSDWSTVTRAVTLDTATDTSRTVHRTAEQLLDRLGWAGRRVRLLGVRLEGLVPTAEVTEQLQFGAPEGPPEWRVAESVMDRVSERFGPTAVRPASLVSGGPRPDRESPPKRDPVR